MMQLNFKHVVNDAADKASHEAVKSVHEYIEEILAHPQNEPGNVTGAAFVACAAAPALVGYASGLLGTNMPENKGKHPGDCVCDESVSYTALVVRLLTLLRVDDTLRSKMESGEFEATARAAQDHYTLTGHTYSGFEADKRRHAQH